MINRVRYNLQETQRNLFFQMPKFLFEEEFKGLSNDARVLYCLLKDRHELSIKNNWVDDDLNVFLIYTREEMQYMLGLSENTVAKAMKNLKAFNLVEEERQGLGKPNKIYLLTTTNVDFTKNRKFYGSGNSDFTGQEPQDLRANNTYINNNNYINNQVMSSQSKEIKQKEENIKNDMTKTIDYETTKKEPLNQITDQSNSLTTSYVETEKSINDYSKYLEIIKSNIYYDDLMIEYKYDHNTIDEIINTILDVIFTQNDTIKINGEIKNREMVKSVYLKLNYSDIEYIIGKFKEQRNKIININSYLKTMLYNCKQEQSHYYTNLVRADGIV